MYDIKMKRGISFVHVRYCKVWPKTTCTFYYVFTLVCISFRLMTRIAHAIIEYTTGKSRTRLMYYYAVRCQWWVGTNPWWRHQTETFSALLALCAGNSPVTGEFPTQRPVTRSFDVSLDLRLNKPLSKQSWGWWFETLSRPLWRHCNAVVPLRSHGFVP